MTLSSKLRFAEFANQKQKNVTNVTLTGDTFVTDYGNNYWSFTITSAPFSLAEAGDNMPLSNNNTDVYSFVLPSTLKDTQGTATGTVTVSASTFNGNRPTVGSMQVGVTGGTGSFKNGDFIKFSNHTKVYMLTADVNLDGSTVDEIYFYPPLIKNVAGATVVYNNVPINAVPTSDGFEYDVGTTGYVSWSQDFREVI
jgi:hypothetical protein